MPPAPNPKFSMDQQALRSLLEQLHLELASNPPTDDRSRRLLHELQADIERAVAPAPGSAPGETPAAPPADLRARLQNAVASFEGTHPQTTAALERVMVLLSNFGL